MRGVLLEPKRHRQVIMTSLSTATRVASVFVLAVALITLRFLIPNIRPAFESDGLATVLVLLLIAFAAVSLSALLAFLVLQVLRALEEEKEASRVAREKIKHS